MTQDTRPVRIIFGHRAEPVRNPVPIPMCRARPAARASRRVRAGRWLLAGAAVVGYLALLGAMTWTVIHLIAHLVHLLVH